MATPVAVTKFEAKFHGSPDEVCSPGKTRDELASLKHGLRATLKSVVGKKHRFVEGGMRGVTFCRRTQSTTEQRTASFSLMLCMLVVAALTCLGVLPPAAAQSLSKGNGDLRVMTYNVNEGTDFLQVGNAQTLQQFLIGVGQIITQVRATNPPQRMQAVAKQIIAAGPTLVSLQELDQWFSGPFDPRTGLCGSVNLEFDMLQELLGALAAQGAHYAVAVVTPQYAFPPTPGLILPSTFFCAQLNNFNAILVRTDLKDSRFSWSNPQLGQFENVVLFPTPLGTVPLPRAWVSVDASFNGKVFRFIGTHLESADATIRELQGAELRDGPANTSLPIIVAMDSNAQAAPLPPDPTYLDFIGLGYHDAWSEIFPNVSGFTCCQAQLVNNPVSELYQRIDLILTRGSVQAQNIALFGVSPVSMTAGGLWPSDHAGVAAQVVIEK